MTSRSIALSNQFKEYLSAESELQLASMTYTDPYMTSDLHQNLLKTGGSPYAASHQVISSSHNDTLSCEQQNRQLWIIGTTVMRIATSFF